jgi:hypothetical protein
MKTWKEVSKIYPDYLKRIKNSQPRLSALVKIEEYLQERFPKLLQGDINLTNIGKKELKNKYEGWKGLKLNGAEEQVFNDYYKICEH